MLILGMQKALEGKRVGDTINTTLTPDEGFGLRKKDLIQNMEKALFETEDLRSGMQFSIQTDEGQKLVKIDSVDGNEVIVDLNHPLAGLELTIQSKIIGIRKATDEEIKRDEVR